MKITLEASCAVACATTSSATAKILIGRLFPRFLSKLWNLRRCSAVVDHHAGVLAFTLPANHFIAAVAPMRVVRTAGGTAAICAGERSGATLLSILGGRIVAAADRGLAGKIDRHEDTNSAPGGDMFGPPSSSNGLGTL
jgi:hypothetical protein